MLKGDSCRLVLTHCVGSPEEDLSDAAVTLEAVVEAM